ADPEGPAIADANGTSRRSLDRHYRPAAELRASEHSGEAEPAGCADAGGAAARAAHGGALSPLAGIRRPGPGAADRGFARSYRVGHELPYRSDLPGSGGGR